MSDFEDIVKGIMERIRETNVETIFGESRQIGDKVIIPVGKISYGWGGGSGKGKAPGQEGEGEGGGIGMGVKVKPIGYITVNQDSVVYQSIIDFSKILAILVPMLVLMIHKKNRRCSRIDKLSARR